MRVSAGFQCDCGHERGDGASCAGEGDTLDDAGFGEGFCDGPDLVGLHEALGVDGSFDVMPTVVICDLFAVHEGDDFGVSALVVDGEGEGRFAILDPGEGPASDATEDVDRFGGHLLDGDLHRLWLFSGLS